MKRKTILKGLYAELLEDLGVFGMDLTIKGIFNQDGDFIDYEFSNDENDKSKELSGNLDPKSLVGKNFELFCMLKAIQAAALIYKELSGISFEYSIVAVYREVNDYTLRFVGDKVNLSHQAILNYEKGKRKPSEVIMKKFYDYFKIPEKYKTLPSQYYEMQNFIENIKRNELQN